MAENRADSAEQDKKFKVVTVEGVRMRVDPQTMDDMRVLDLLDDVQSATEPGGNRRGAFKLAKLFKIVCGRDYGKVMQHLQLPDGRVPIERAGHFLNELMNKLNPNSRSSQ